MPDDQRNELSEAELASVRKMLEDDRAARKLWAMFRAAAVWIVAVIAGFVTFYDSVAKMLHRWFDP
jgi:hypothetical protein